MNAGESVHSVARMRALASTITLVRRQFPAAQANLTPWRDDPQTRQWTETESLDLSFHFPGWSPTPGMPQFADAIARQHGAG